MPGWLRIALCDLRRMFKDKLALFWMLVMPLGFVYLFGSMIGDPTLQQTWLPVFNHDQGELGAEFTEQLKADKFIVDIRSATEEQYIPNWHRALVIPATFTESILAGDEVEVTFTKGGGNQEHTLAAQARTVQAAAKFVGALASADVVNNRWTSNTQAAFREALAAEPQMRIEKKELSRLRPPPFGSALTLPGYIIMFVLMNTIMFGGVTLAEDRSKRIDIRLSASPLGPMEVFAGKMAGRILVPLVQAALLATLGHWIYSVPLGEHPLALIPVLLCFCACCGAIAIFFGTVCSTEQQIFGFGMMFTMFASGLGGCWWPLEIVPPFLKTVALFTPTYWGVTGLHDVMSFGKSFNAIVMECLMLLFFAALFLSASMAYMRLKER